MNTKWNMAAFLFLGFIGALLIMHTVISRNEGGRSKSIIISCICSVATLGIIIAGLNDPSKIVTILSTPTKGFSSAIIMQAVLCLMGLLLFLQHQKRSVQIIAALVSILSVCALGRIYMISTRPALNSSLVSTMMVLLLIQMAGIISLRPNTSKRFKQILLTVCSLYGVILMAFTVRLKMLSPQDRILDFANLTTGSLAPIFWSFILFTFIIPFVYVIYAMANNKTHLATIVSTMNAIGVFLLCLLISQMPAIEKGINNRIFFN